MLVFELKQFFAATTPVICKKDRDCHKNRATIVSPALVKCSRRHRTVFSKEYKGKMTAYFYEKETEGGKCALGKISQITI